MFRACSSNRSSREKIPWDEQWGGGGKVTCERPTVSVGYTSPQHGGDVFFWGVQVYCSEKAHHLTTLERKDREGEKEKRK